MPIPESILIEINRTPLSACEKLLAMSAPDLAAQLDADDSPPAEHLALARRLIIRQIARETN